MRAGLTNPIFQRILAKSSAEHLSAQLTDDTNDDVSPLEREIAYQQYVAGEDAASWDTDTTVEEELTAAAAGHLSNDHKADHGLSSLIPRIEIALERIQTGSSRHKHTLAPTPRRTICALSIAVAWRRARGRPVPHTSHKAQEACRLLWVLAGGSRKGGAGVAIRKADGDSLVQSEEGSGSRLAGPRSKAYSGYLHGKPPLGGGLVYSYNQHSRPRHLSQVIKRDGNLQVSISATHSTLPPDLQETVAGLPPER